MPVYALHNFDNVIVTKSIVSIMNQLDILNPYYKSYRSVTTVSLSLSMYSVATLQHSLTLR